MFEVFESVCMLMCTCEYIVFIEFGNACLYVLSDLLLLYVWGMCLNLVNECLCYVYVYMTFVVDRHMLMSVCFFIMRLIFAARLLKLPPVHLQRLLRLFSNNSDSVVSWPCA